MDEPGSLEELADLVEPWLTRLCGDSMLQTILAIVLLGPIVVAIATTAVVCLNLVMLGNLMAKHLVSTWHVTFRRTSRRRPCDSGASSERTSW